MKNDLFEFEEEENLDNQLDWLSKYLQNNPQTTMPLDHYLIVSHINDFC